MELVVDADQEINEVHGACSKNGPQGIVDQHGICRASGRVRHVVAAVEDMDEHSQEELAEHTGLCQTKQLRVPDLVHVSGGKASIIFLPLYQQRDGADQRVLGRREGEASLTFFSFCQL